jgi:hypothetical protein
VSVSFRKCFGFRQRDAVSIKILVGQQPVVTHYLPQRCQAHRHCISRHDVTAARTELLNNPLYEEVRHVVTLTLNLECKSGVTDVTIIVFLVCNPIGTEQLADFYVLVY